MKDILMGRSRSKIENETFSTLKNLGYHYGHGEDPFPLPDADGVPHRPNSAIQVKALDKGIYPNIRTWERMRAVCKIIESESMEFICRKIAHSSTRSNWNKFLPYRKWLIRNCWFPPSLLASNGQFN
jgi:hypothetical protein